jgi:hypothetical protein
MASFERNKSKKQTRGYQFKETRRVLMRGENPRAEGKGIALY